MLTMVTDKTHTHTTNYKNQVPQITLNTRSQVNTFNTNGHHTHHILPHFILVFANTIFSKIHFAVLYAVRVRHHLNQKHQVRGWGKNTSKHIYSDCSPKTTRERWVKGLSDVAEATTCVSRLLHHYLCTPCAYPFHSSSNVQRQTLFLFPTTKCSFTKVMCKSCCFSVSILQFWLQQQSSEKTVLATEDRNKKNNNV